jgi:hypothetical protein
MNYLPYISTVVTFAFTVAVYNRYRQRGGIHLLLWTIGLLFYGLGTLSEVILGVTFNVHLLVRRGNTAMILTWVLAAVSLLAAILVFAVPAVSSYYNVALPASEQYKDILTRSGLTILFTILLNIYGTLTLVGGAIYSAFLFWRKKILANRMFGNILIAAGALSPAMGGTLLKAGFTDMLYLSELIGAILMFFGFLMATSGTAATE